MRLRQILAEIYPGIFKKGPSEKEHLQSELRVASRCLFLTADENERLELELTRYRQALEAIAQGDEPQAAGMAKKTLGNFRPDGT